MHILDPFTGTGTFITRLLQSGLIAPDELEHKYRHEIHANEIVLLAYYIAAVNIETVYHELAQGGLQADAPYHPFTGILLTDTFQMYEQERDMVANLLPDNSERRSRQKALDIRVIIGNPPYSIGQDSENDNAANIVYSKLDERIRETYAQRSQRKLSRALYDSYVRAFRWASDRIGESGVLAFVSSAGWVETTTADGMRECIAEEFSDLFIFHLRGNQRTSGELSRKEGGKIFGSGSRAPIAISVLVKNPNAVEHGRIHFHDIGNYLDQKEKLGIIRSFHSISGIAESDGWRSITPDKNNDWLDQTDDSFETFLPIASKDDAVGPRVFGLHSLGVVTARDAWVVNSSPTKLRENVRRMISAYDDERQRFAELGKTFPNARARNDFVDRFVTDETKRISWSRALKASVGKQTKIKFDPNKIRRSTYRPFTPQWLYFDRQLNEVVYQMPRAYPSEGIENLCICVPARCSPGLFSGFVVSAIPDLNLAPNMGGYQCFPLYLYEETKPDDGLFATVGDQASGLTRRDAITDEGLAHFQAAYPGKEISKEDLFYYIYGLLHSPDYRERFKNNLAKRLPRIPAVKTFADFAAFRDAGRALGHLHVNFESVEPYMVTFKEGDHRLIPEAQADPVKFYRVKKMKLGGKGKTKDRTTVIYNDRITMQNIPLAAWDYVVNGKPALDWVMERQVVKTDPASGITNDANDYANETIGDPRYPLELFQRVITVSLETMKIVNGLPELEIA